MTKFLLSTALLTTVFAGSVVAQEMTKSQIENIVKNFIANNPEVILDSVESYGRKQKEMAQGDRQKSVDEHINWILDNDALPVAGNPDGSVTVVEFYDYNCGYCKKSLTDVMTLMENNKEVKVIFMEMPILGRMSDAAARWALAAKDQGAFLPYHIALMQNRGPITQDVLERIARENDLDITKMQEYADSNEADKLISEKMAKANAMGISGTPAFIIDGQLYGGYIGLEAMQSAVTEAKEG
jgi:protein-disulfide isomerase